MLINFVDATNDANHYTKPPVERTCVKKAQVCAAGDVGDKQKYYL